MEEIGETQTPVPIQKKPGWNKLSIISFIMLLIFPVYFFLILYITQPSIIDSGLNIIIRILVVLLFLCPAISLILGFISYTQIKGFISHPKIQKNKEKGAFLSLISIILGIPLTFAWYFLIYIFSVSGSNSTF